MSYHSKISKHLKDLSQNWETWGDQVYFEFDHYQNPYLDFNYTAISTLSIHHPLWAMLDLNLHQKLVFYESCNYLYYDNFVEYSHLIHFPSFSPPAALCFPHTFHSLSNNHYWPNYSCLNFFSIFCFQTKMILYVSSSIVVLN